eukprot:TRINITY_DN9627_c0_g1_i1.p1 TRINITY_DN9627_c0_g1~~TRINITY_DN9627_c0_g1_i1.p1  ORF type:complete len:118 (+),score=13.26 TRINITY_DN9627_c0_g1_i1:115-468(+)
MSYKGDETYTLQISTLSTNKLLQRREMSLEILHIGVGTIPKAKIQRRLKEIFTPDDLNQIVLFGFTSDFGGGVTRGNAFIYDSLDAFILFEARYNLAKVSKGCKKEFQKKAPWKSEK